MELYKSVWNIERQSDRCTTVFSSKTERPNGQYATISYNNTERRTCRDAAMSFSEIAKPSNRRTTISSNKTERLVDRYATISSNNTERKVSQCDAMSFSETENPGSQDATMSSYLSAVKWGDEDYYLKEFTEKFPLPQVAKIVKGQYLNVGLSSFSSPNPNNTVFLVTGGKRIKVAAQCVKFKDKRRVIIVGPKLAIPDNYDGWFEILSEGGQPVRCIENVAELAKRFPSMCLVRENIKVFTSKSEENISDKTKTLQVGEVIHLIKEVLAAPLRGKAPGRFLRCLTSRKETVYLSVEQRGKFSPVAGEDNISGVHRIKTILNKRLPLMVRLVHGKPPNCLKPSFRFLPEMRLYSMFEEECVLALPFQQDSAVVPLPLTASLKLLGPQNVETLVKLREYAKLCQKCKEVIRAISDKIQVFDIALKKEVQNQTKAYPNLDYFKTNVSEVRRSLSDPQEQGKEEKIVSLKREFSAPGENTHNKGVDTDDYDEIDKIYESVRGFISLPEMVKTKFSTSGSHFNLETSSTLMSPVPHSSLVVTDPQEQGDKPEPPPIQTIPPRRTSNETEPTKETAQKIIINIVNKQSHQLKEDLLRNMDSHCPIEHIYERIGDIKGSVRSYQNKRRAPLRSYSAGMINVSGKHQNNNFTNKNGPHHGQVPKKRLFKCSKSYSIPFQRHCGTNTCILNKSVTMPSLSNTRYKSINNLNPEYGDTLTTNNFSALTPSFLNGCKETTKRHHRDHMYFLEKQLCKQL
ncbi:uncharacterized protein LOC143241841 isoform X2 [Tachypleus tridentatus]|uniref:uncharacterized protein LOC143241841 isoform X2 n=1 Tax=Tachypleus tridentatus TaxID=6853 RepID=UPI003FD65B7E